eukprot:CAMPEP_0119552382 /NCGR_PEP_ID=MMETSP1352-20130426/5404_1 /TAXON_ID=265584 /ORGANISM="Stauroneis constricta, Strain CCMP1120" /LENGTH=452 /DNA_ID=CAMNT_0007598615 /DNA_START=121 /DNA_END=1479 /DNA_ORIENTATION=+
MSGAQGGNFGNGGKKAVHVKWAGKTIALGTFPSAEADEKCARAKALTRAWRSTMRPKPSRDWVMLELERLGVRVVSGRLGRKAGDDDDAEKKAAAAAELSRTMPPVDRNNSMGWATNPDLDNLMQRRSSSLGLSLMNDNDKRRSSLGSLGPALGLETGDPAMPPHRPFVGGGAAAAYEASRADHYAQQQQQQRRASSLGLGIGGGGLGGPGAGMQMGLSVNPNQHYEMLKLHHMNLLNEIQETTLMMNLYQQQQIQQQQQQLQQQTGADVQADQMATLLHQQAGVPGAGLDQLYGGGAGLSHRGSLGLGTSGDEQQLQLLRQQQMLHNSAAPPTAAPSSAAAAQAPAPGSTASIQEDLAKGEKERAALEEQLKKLKDDIARRQREKDELESTKAARAANSGAPLAESKAEAKSSQDDSKRKHEKAAGGGPKEGGDSAKRQKVDQLKAEQTNE